MWSHETVYGLFFSDVLFIVIFGHISNHIYPHEIVLSGVYLSPSVCYLLLFAPKGNVISKMFWPHGIVLTDFVFDTKAVALSSAIIDCITCITVDTNVIIMCCFHELLILCYYLLRYPQLSWIVFCLLLVWVVRVLSAGVKGYVICCYVVTCLCSSWCYVSVFHMKCTFLFFKKKGSCSVEYHYMVLSYF